MHGQISTMLNCCDPHYKDLTIGLALNSHDLRSNHHVFLNEVNYVTKAG